MKSKFEGLRGAGKQTAAPPSVGPTRGRPKSTAPDAAPVTLHVSADTLAKARIRLLQTRDKRPLSRIVELLLDGWSTGDIKLDV